ncbi:uncharacterized protein N7482_002129 [Penicillium canariense]|uniref:Xylanolytic transcriptional activator regulatory domain-containing protein n=1 Tax=Penicillium canariense TaxID=189055 RepID=A0A9W9LUU8_9EURO|nr:uncharacterized protein N7482_002129 [Penicillium canariense]KAJ5176252.1 hypothetical protein N7482_002129 [Penicillium canariense]
MDLRKRSSSAASTPDKVFLEACDIYFRHCHNKPYGFFNAELFQQQAAKNQVPLHLRLALIATATRYSSRSQWRERKQSTIDSYARCSWELIVTSPNGFDDDDVTVIQALALLAVIDATAGRRRGAWVKIGMAVRISQDLQLMLEPGSGFSNMERDERRHLFWSLYLLDRFVGCSFQRPPAIQDSDCRLNLPTPHYSRNLVPYTTLKGLLDERNRDLSMRPGMFGISIALASVLGRTIKCMMNEADKIEAPWHLESAYRAICTDLEFLKELAVSNSPVLAAPGQARPPHEMQDRDREQIAHMVLSHTLYHLSHCILSHPYLLGLKMQSLSRSDMPPTWLEDTRATCLMHAGSVITVLVEAKAAGYMPVPSVYSYCILVASTIHALYLHSDDMAVGQSSAEYLKTSLEYLGEVSELWTYAQTMASALRSFAVQCGRYSDLLLRDEPLVDELTTTESAVLCSVIDYWAMMDPHNPVFDVAQPRTDGPLDLLDVGPGYLTPPTPGAVGAIPLEAAMSHSPGHKTSDLVDPDILIHYPVSIMSPMASEEGGSPAWDWDSELNAMID